ncbi:hypothetical protein SMMN14_07755 [Sphaerulina musiva]
MAIRGGFLRLVMITAYAIAFCCAAIITGAFAWFLVERDNSSNIASLVLGVLTLIYCTICILVTCCTAGTFLAYIGVLLDLVHIGLMMAISIMEEEEEEEEEEEIVERCIRDWEEMMWMCDVDCVDSKGEGKERGGGESLEKSMNSK